jgi:hypothetical protein
MKKMTKNQRVAKVNLFNTLKLERAFEFLTKGNGFITYKNEYGNVVKEGPKFTPAYYVELNRIDQYEFDVICSYHAVIELMNLIKHPKAFSYIISAEGLNTCDLACLVANGLAELNLECINTGFYCDYANRNIESITKLLK